jgi:hypothetical protein
MKLPLGRPRLEGTEVDLGDTGWRGGVDLSGSGDGTSERLM